MNLAMRMQRAAFFVLLLISAVAVSAQPIDGNWTGTQENGKPLNFSVLNGGTRINPFSFGYFGCSRGGTQTIYGNITISGNQFSASGGGCPSFTTSGTFTGTAAASGTLTLIFNATDTGCTCTETQNHTWSASTAEPPGPTADLAVTQTDNGAVPNLGGAFQYTITATNFGPTDVVGANLTDYFSFNVSAVSWTCSASAGSSCTAGGSGSINDTALNLLSGDSATYVASVTVAMGAIGPIFNSVAIGAPAGVFDLVTANNVSAQATAIFGQAYQWIPQNSDAPNSLSGVHFSSDTDGWVSGASKTILHTTNGGRTWTRVTHSAFDVMDGFNSVASTDANVAWAGSNDGAVRSGDAGMNWIRAWNPPVGPSGVSHVSLVAVSPTVAWAVGQKQLPQAPCGLHFRFTYNGTALIPERFDNGCGNVPIAGLTAIFMLDEDNGWTIGPYGRVMRVSNGRSTPPTFTDQLSGTGAHLTAVQMINANRGWIVGSDGTVLTTADGGATPWTAQNSGVTTALTGIHFIDPDNGWAVGVGGVIRATVDGGLNWTTEASNVSSNLRRVFCRPSGICWAVGTNGTILKRVGDRVFANGFEP